MSVTDVEKESANKVSSSNTAEALLEDLQARGYKLWVNENGRLAYEAEEPITPVIWHALQANYGNLVRLLGGGVTGAEKETGEGVSNRNAVVELIKNRAVKTPEDRRRFRQLIKPAQEETRRAMERASAVVKHKVETGGLKFSDPRDGYWQTVFEYRERLPPEVEEARRLAAEARKTAEVCGLCGKDTQADEVVYQSRVCTGIAVVFGSGPIYADTVLCEDCAPDYMVREAKGASSRLRRFVERKERE